MSRGVLDVVVDAITSEAALKLHFKRNNHMPGSWMTELRSMENGCGDRDVPLLGLDVV